jgi:hypothetical protein
MWNVSPNAGTLGPVRICVKDFNHRIVTAVTGRKALQIKVLLSQMDVARYLS